MSEVPKALRDAYDPERLRADGHRLIDALADQLAASQRREGKALPWRPQAEARRAWAEEGLEGGELVEDLARFARASTALANPRVMAHQVPPPLPGAALAELVSALLNNGMAVAEMGPAAVPIELNVVEWMCKTLGFPAGAGGVLTSGGSLGNLTALLAMRQAKAGWNVWKEGTHAGPPLAVIVGSDAHYSVARTARIMGWGDGGVIPAQVDREHRMTAAAVKAAAAESGERRVIGIVAAAGSTATGAFDPLPELADLAEARDWWLHVDAAHGGGLALSKTHRHRLAGIERADSVVWDAHKMLMMPALVTAVLYKREASSYEAFAQQASYLFAGTKPSDTWWDLGQRTLECTKRAMAIELWSTLRVHGEAWFGACVDRQIALTHSLAAKLTAAGFEVPLAPTANIVCYRHRPAGMDAASLDAHNRSIRQRLVEDGTFYIVGTQLPNGYHLRSTIMNPLIEERDLDELVAHLQALCR